MGVAILCRIDPEYCFFPLEVVLLTNLEKESCWICFRSLKIMVFLDYGQHFADVVENDVSVKKPDVIADGEFCVLHLTQNQLCAKCYLPERTRKEISQWIFTIVFQRENNGENRGKKPAENRHFARGEMSRD